MSSPVLFIILQICWELPVSLFINIHEALFLFLADKTNLSIPFYFASFTTFLKIFW